MTFDWATCERGDLMLDFLRKENQLSKNEWFSISIALCEESLKSFSRRYPKVDILLRAISCAVNPMTCSDGCVKECRNFALQSTAAQASAPAWACYYACLIPPLKDASRASIYAAACSDCCCDTSIANYVADAVLTERRIQANIIRELVKNPFHESNLNNSSLEHAAT